MRQRTIPVKQEIQVQTDVNLIGVQSVPPSLPNLVLSELTTSQGLLHPFSDNYELAAFATSLKEFNQEDPVRLQLLQKQINGLLKRTTMHQTNEYYSLLLAKDQQVQALERDHLHTQLQLDRSNRRLNEITLELTHANATIASFQLSAERHKHQEELLTTLSQSLKQGKPLPLLQQQMAQLLLQTNNRLNTRSLPTSIRALAQSYTRELERLIHNPTQATLKQSLLGLQRGLQALSPDEAERTQWERAARCDQAQTNYKNVVSLMRRELAHLRQDHPSLKSLAQLDQLVQTLDNQKVDLIECKGVLTVTKYESKTQVESAHDGVAQGALLMLANSYSQMLQLYPQMQVAANVRELLRQVPQLISSNTLDRLHSIVVPQTHTIRVDNIYQYQDGRRQQEVFSLRVLVKALVQELSTQQGKFGFACSLDQSVLQLIRAQALDHIHPQTIAALFTPMAKTVEVDRLRQVPTMQVRTLTQQVPIRVEKPILVRETQQEIIEVREQVPLYVERPLQTVVSRYVGVQVLQERVVEVVVGREVVVERVHERRVGEEVVVEKVVGVESVREIAVPVEVVRIVEVPQVVEVERVVEQVVQQVREVEVVREVGVILYETRQVIQEVEVKVDRMVSQVEYVEIEKKVPYLIKSREVVYLEREKPVIITQVVEKEVAVVEYRDRLIPVKEIVEVIKEVAVVEEKELVVEVAKEVLVTRSHFVKGDTVQLIKEVEVVVEKPIVKEVLLTKEVQVEKMVPLYIREQVVLPTQINTPYLNETVVEVVREKVVSVPVRNEVVKEVVREKPVPIIVERETVRVETQIVEKIVEKVIEVPRVVQVEKIVEKIVVVPRIVERIVEVERVVEKVVVVEKPILQIVEIEIPMLIVQQVEVVREVIVEKEVIKYVTNTQIVEREKLVEVIVEREVAVEVVLERRIPVEVIRQVPVEVFRDRIEYQVRELHQVKVQTVDVPIVFLHQEKVLFLVEKPIVKERIVQKLKCQREVIEREVAIHKERQVVNVVEVKVECPVVEEVVREVQGPQTICYVPSYVEVRLTSEKAVPVQVVREVPREIYLSVDKVVEVTVERLVEVPVNKVVFVDKLVEVPRPIPVMSYKEIPVEVPLVRERMLYTLNEQVKETPVVREKAVQTQSYREQLIEVMKEINVFVREEVAREVQVPQVVTNSVYQEVMVPSQPLLVPGLQVHDRIVEIQQRVIEKVMEKVVMLPQVVEVVRNVHHISEVNALPISTSSREDYLAQFNGLSTNLKGSLQQVLNLLRARANTTPEVRPAIEALQHHLPLLQQWIRFPKVLQVEKETQKVVEKQKVVLVPTQNKDKIAALSFMVEKCINELKRVRDTHRVDLNIHEDILRIFFSQQWDTSKPLQSKMEELTSALRQKYSSFGQWADTAPFMMSCFMEEHFALHGLIAESNRVVALSKRESERLRLELESVNNMHQQELCNNRVLNTSISGLVQLLRRHNGVAPLQQVQMHLNKYEEVTSSLASSLKESKMNSTFNGFARNTNSFIEAPLQSSQTSYVGQVNTYITEDVSSVYVERASKAERKNAQILRNLNAAQNQLTACRETLKIREVAQHRLQSQIASLKQREYAQPTQSTQAKGQTQLVRNLQEKQRAMEREHEQRNQMAERKLRQVQEGAERKLRQVQEGAERTQKNQAMRLRSELQRENLRVKSELERTLRQRQSQANQAKRRLNQQLNSLKAQSKQNSLSQSQGEITQLRTRVSQLTQQMESERTKLSASSTNNSQKLLFEIEQLRRKCSEQESLLQSERGKTDQSSEITRLRNKIGELEMDIQKEKRKNLEPSGHSIENGQLKKQIILLQSQLQRLRNELQRMKMERTSVQGRKPSSTESFQQKMEIDKLKHENERLSRDLDGVMKERNYKSQVQNELQQKLTNSQTKFREMQLRLITIQTNCTALQATNAALQSKADATSMRKMDNRSAEFKNLEDSYNSMQSNYNSLLTMKNSFEQRVYQLERELRQMRNQHNASDESNEIKQLRSKLRRVQIDFATKSKQLEMFMRPRKSIQPSMDAQLFERAAQGRSPYQLHQVQYRQSFQSPPPYESRGQYGQVRTSYQHHQRMSFQGERSPIQRSPLIRDTLSPEPIRHIVEEEFLSSSSYDRNTVYKQELTMRELIEVAYDYDRENFTIMVMIKILEKIEEECSKNPHYSYPSYSPLNIFISQFNPHSLNCMRITFGTPILLRDDPIDGVYLAPEILRGEQDTKKSFVFNIGIILDELLNSELFFKTVEDILDAQAQFKIREEKNNPILKNSLFEIMNKDPAKRLQLSEAKRRFNLLSFISSERRASFTATKSPSQQ